MTDHSISTTNVLWHIYMTLHLLPMNAKCQLIIEILKKHWFRFIFHWSHHIRDIFGMIILYQIDYVFCQVDPSHYESLEISPHYVFADKEESLPIVKASTSFANFSIEIASLEVLQPV